MSHWTKIKTNISNREILLRALTRMELEYQIGQFLIERYGSSEQAQILLCPAVGLSLQDDGTYALVGDCYYAPRGHKLHRYYENETKFSTDLATAYGICEDADVFEIQGFYLSEETVETDGTIQIVYERIS